MNITTQLVFRHFLQSYQKIIEASKSPTISPFFEHFFTREELINILDFMFGGVGLEQIDLETATNEELLATIDDELYILRYFLNQWENELDTHNKITPRAVYNTLLQLGYETHYLGQKDIIEWDEYDISNYISLQHKAGKIVSVFGIYEVSVSQEDVYSVDSHPKRLFKNKEDAQEILELGISKSTFEKDSVHVLECYRAI